jgi:hypothetical protein
MIRRARLSQKPTRVSGDVNPVFITQALRRCTGLLGLKKPSFGLAYWNERARLYGKMAVRALFMALGWKEKTISA